MAQTVSHIQQLCEEKLNMNIINDVELNEVPEFAEQVDMNYESESDDDEKEEFDPRTTQPAQYSKKCRFCGIEIHAHCWGVGCYGHNCKAFYHRGCMLPHFKQKTKMLCIECFNKEYTFKPTTTPNKLRCFRIFRVKGVEIYYFDYYDDKSDHKIYIKTSDHLKQHKLSKIELECILQYDRQLYDQYRIKFKEHKVQTIQGYDVKGEYRLGGDKELIEVEKEVKLASYTIGVDDACIGSCEDFGFPATRELLYQQGITFSFSVELDRSRRFGQVGIKLTRSSWYVSSCWI